MCGLFKNYSKLKPDTFKSIVTTVVKCKNEVLLQIAHTFVYTANDGLVHVRILMDVGNQCSYLSNDLKKKLKLKPLKQENVTVNTFGSEEYNKRKCDLIKVRLQAKQGKDVEITATKFLGHLFTITDSHPATKVRILICKN